MKYFLYILQSENSQKYYIGISQNLELRLTYHNSTEKGFTARYRPWKIVFTKKYNFKKEALISEKKPRNGKVKL
ncbi:MAG: GIY-YIG nuclease family protein [Melioribacteraceae bacterium]